MAGMRSHEHPQAGQLPTLSLLLRSCGLNARLVQNTEASALKEVKESLLIIKTTE